MEKACFIAEQEGKKGNYESIQQNLDELIEAGKQKLAEQENQEYPEQGI